MKKYKIIYDDQDLLVVCKFAGLAVQSARVSTPDLMSLLRNEMLERGEKKPYLGLVNRLDQPVEGLLVFAKTQNAAKKLSADLQNGRLKKYYHALVPLQPALDRKEGHLTDYLCKDGRTNLSRVVSRDNAEGKKAQLEWKLCGQYSQGENNYALAEIELFTGRHHQIRVQMSHAGMPLLGDNKYGNEESEKLSHALGIRHTALLANFVPNSVQNWLYRKNSYTEFFARAQFIKDFLSRIRYNFSKPGSVSDAKMLRIPLIFGITFLFIL